MPRNDANNSNNEAECLPKKLTARTTTTTTANTSPSKQQKFQQQSQPTEHQKQEEEQEKEQQQEHKFDQHSPHQHSPQEQVKEDSIKTIAKNSPQQSKNSETKGRKKRKNSSGSPSTSTRRKKKRTSDSLIRDQLDEWRDYLIFTSESEPDSSPTPITLYPTVIDITPGRGGHSVHAIISKARVKRRLSSSTSSSSSSPVSAPDVPVTLCTKSPPFASRKRKSRFRGASFVKDYSRIASLRERKKPTPVAANKNKRGAASPRKKSLPIKEEPPAVPKARPPQLTAADFDRIDVLEFDESKFGAGTSGGSRRKRNNSLTSGVLPILTRKRATTIKNFAISRPVHTVEPKRNLSGGNVGNTANNNMSLYDRRYQAAAAAAAAAAATTTSADDGGGRIVVGNGYLSSTRASSSNDSGLPELPMEAQYYLTTGGGVSSTASSALLAGIPCNGGNTGATTTATLNHAPSMATLCNIGNSCYLNSVVYTLRFAPRFLHNLHHLVVDLATVQQNVVRHRVKTASLGRGMNAAQLENSARSWSSKDLASMEQYSSIATTSTAAQAAGGNVAEICKSRHQLLTEKLHELFQSLHRNEIAESTEPHHADKLLHAMQDVSAIFEGNQQQDAHEFLMCVLNSIRETCQTLIKTIADYPELLTEGNIVQPDEVDANEKDLTAAGIIMNANAPSSSSLSTSNFTKTSFFSRKSKRKDEAKSAKSYRLQSPLKDAASGSQQQQQPQTVANSHFYLNSVDLSSAAATATATATTPAATTSAATATNTDSSPTSATATTSFDKLTNSACSDTTDLAATNPLAKQRLAEKIRELGLDFFSEDFEGITVATTKCLSCETVTEQKESMIDIAVPVPISGFGSSDQTEKPSAFIQNSCITREYFRGENKYRCEQCTGYTEAIRSISYEVLPRLLVIQLSRFSGGMEKINSYMPTSFTLQCFCSKCCKLSDENKLHIYKLYSVITHVGATMSVGHYIAYTSSLDWANEFVNCPKDRRASAVGLPQLLRQPNGLIPQMREVGMGNSNNSSASSTQTSAASAAASALASSGTSLMKKMKFGRSKASSSGDISKNLKNLNGMTTAAANSQAITNGISKLTMDTTCHSLNCCATRLSTVKHQYQQQRKYNLSDFSEESIQNGANHNAVAASSSSSIGSYASCSSGYGSTGRGGTKTTPYAASSNGTEPIWYMCDDDKIKAMTQREFEELLSPARKITITPYLLFYARFELKPASADTVSASPAEPETVAAASTKPAMTTTPPSQKSQRNAMSWSDESLPSGGNALPRI